MTSTESSTALAHRARTATETSTDALNLAFNLPAHF